MLSITAYQRCISPFVAGCCRFQPSCSAYARQAIAEHGCWRGLWLGVRRLARCHPWGGCGYDPAPLRKATSCGTDCASSRQK
ncbi:MAG: membrane protein insertion efficiency factor YidD [Bacteroidota bacterium]